MKSTKSTKAKPANKEEECGIWLDTKELKEKKLTLQRRPVAGFSLSMALSFTQTKLNMPVTRQSTISSFFTARPSELSAKRKTPEDGDEDEEGPADRDEKERRFLHLICGEEDEPPEKRRHVAHHHTETREERHGPSQEESPGPKDEHTRAPRAQKLSVLTSRPVHEQLRRPGNISPVKRTGKENRRPSSSTQNAHSSPFKRLTERHTLSPAGETLASLFTQDSEGFCVIAHRDASSEVKGRSKSPWDEDEDMLFTQDSEGNMVIKH